MLDSRMHSHLNLGKFGPRILIVCFKKHVLHCWTHLATPWNIVQHCFDESCFTDHFDGPLSVFLFAKLMWNWKILKVKSHRKRITTILHVHQSIPCLLEFPTLYIFLYIVSLILNCYLLQKILSFPGKRAERKSVTV